MANSIDVIAVIGCAKFSRTLRGRLLSLVEQDSDCVKHLLLAVRIATISVIVTLGNNFRFRFHPEENRRREGPSVSFVELI